MTVDCDWMSKNLESYFCDTLNAEQSRLARSHIELCAKCQKDIQEFTAIDSLIQKYFRQQLVLAQSPKRRPAAVVYGAAVAAGIAAILLLAVVLRMPESGSRPAGDLSQPQLTAAPDPAPLSPVIKNQDSSGTSRAKPDQPAQVEPAGPDVQSPAIAANAPAFLVTDPAGYSRTLQDYRGYTLVIGVWSSDSPESAEAIERVYRAFGSNPQLRILGVSNRRASKPVNTTFPIAFNDGSRLFDAQTGEFVVVDASGSVRLRGSLTRDLDLLSAALKD